MTAGSSAVKATAKTALKGKWIKSIVASIILASTVLIFAVIGEFVLLFAGNIAAVIYRVLFAVFVVMPLFLGTLRFFWRLLFGMEDDPVILFYYFSSQDLYRRALKLCLSLTVRIAVIGAVLFLPAAVADMLSKAEFYEAFGNAIPMWVSNLWPVSVLLKSAAGVALALVVIRYYAAPVLFVADDSIDTAEAIHMSSVIARGSYADFVYLVFSFLGWILLCFLYVPIVFILPYLLVSYLVHVRFAVAYFNKRVSRADQAPTFSGV